MSGSLAIGLGAAASIEALAAGPAVMIGNIALFGFEVPDAIPWGTDQQLVDHRMPGGGRIVDAMGPVEAWYWWRGAFTGPTAAYRAHQMDVMAAAGAAVPLIWGEDFRLVVIRSFRCATTRGGWWLPYTITCIGIPQPGAAAQQPTLLGQTNSDLTNAAAVPGAVNPSDPVLAQAGAAVATAQASVPVSGNLVQGSAAANASAAAMVQSSERLASLTAPVQTSVGALAAPGGGGLLTPAGQGGAEAAVQSAVSSTGQLAGLSSMSNSIARSAVNLGVAP